MSKVEDRIGDLYRTTCLQCRSEEAQVKYFLWVKQQICRSCHRPIDLFPSFVIAKNQRHPRHVLVCPACGILNEAERLNGLSIDMTCAACGTALLVKGPAQRNTCTCSHCGSVNEYPDELQGPPQHRLFALEYYCPACKTSHRGRFFKAPDEQDLLRLREVDERLAQAEQSLADFIPSDPILPGDETARLHRWGYETYRQLFNGRQLLGLASLVEQIAMVEDEVIRHALLTVFSDTLRYQNMLCRYDSYALKVLDIFSIHGFPVSLVQCESSLLGIPEVGSGGYRHFVAKYDRAKAYCEQPFETLPGRPRKTVSVPGEKILAHMASAFPQPEKRRAAFLHSAPADSLVLPEGSLDAVLTDPPYFGNVQYAELMDFCYVWLRKHLRDSFPAFRSPSTRAVQELTVNQTEGRDIYDFADGLADVFRTFALALKPGNPFAFTYHHNELDAYLPVAVALLDARLVCTASLPCPAEMGASIHISGTKSSVVDTIFVCRSTGTVRKSQFLPNEDTLKKVLLWDLEQLQDAGLSPSIGDARCLLFGHLTRLVVWQLRLNWHRDAPIHSKLESVERHLQQIYPLDLVDQLANRVASFLSNVDLLANMRTKERENAYVADTISF